MAKGRKDTVQMAVAFSGLVAVAALVYTCGRFIENYVLKSVIPKVVFDAILSVNIQYNTVGTAIFWMLFGLCANKLYNLFGTNSNPDYEPVGFSHNKFNKNGVKSSYNAFRSRTYPHPFPNGWYPLLYTKELKKGEIKAVHALGRQFAVYRGNDTGNIGIVDAYCPHMGANLTIGGKVCGDRLQCPFHQWQFDLDGKCVNIPYIEGQIPQNANAHSYPCMEFHDMICVYYDAEGREPAYELPVQNDIGDNLVFRGEMEGGIVGMHLQEFADNAADWMHFAPIHGLMMIPFTRYQIPIIGRWLTINHTPGTLVGSEPGAEQYGPTDKHFLYFLDHAKLQWNGKDIPETDADANITFCGPGGICIFRFEIPRFGNIVMFHTHLPVEDVKQRVRFHWYADRKMPRILVWYVVGLWVAQWTQDIDIWENKVHYSKPCIVKGDGPINKVRRWFKQFYSESSGIPDPHTLDW